MLLGGATDGRRWAVPARVRNIGAIHAELACNGETFSVFSVFAPASSQLANG